LVTLAVWRLPLPGRHRYDPRLSIQSPHSRLPRAPARRTPARRATIPGMRIPRLAREAGPARGRRGEWCGSRPDGRQALPPAHPPVLGRGCGRSRLGGGAPGPELDRPPCWGPPSSSGIRPLAVAGPDAPPEPRLGRRHHRTPEPGQYCSPPRGPSGPHHCGWGPSARRRPGASSPPNRRSGAAPEPGRPASPWTPRRQPRPRLGIAGTREPLPQRALP